jgi:hypothetical protein
MTGLSSFGANLHAQPFSEDMNAVLSVGSNGELLTNTKACYKSRSSASK